MADDIIRMVGGYEFHTYAYLWNNANHFYELARAEERGGGINCVAAALFSAFTVEAFLNHLGDARIKTWNLIERKLSIEDKLRVLAVELGIELAWGERPLQTIRSLLQLRDRLAHGKTHREDNDSYEYNRVENAGRARMMPDWLVRYTDLTVAERVLEDTNALWTLFSDKAGFKAHDIACMGHGFYEEASRPTTTHPPGPQSPPSG